MNQKDKELLLKDLCARLPYGVIVDYKENEFEIPHWRITTIYPETLDGWIGYNKRVGAGSESGSRPFKIGDVKPYLRPMSDMTEEEKLDYTSIDNRAYCCPQDFAHIPATDRIDWLNAHHFDYRGLIKKGLAIKVTPENNPYKE